MPAQGATHAQLHSSARRCTPPQSTSQTCTHASARRYTIASTMLLPRRCVTRSSWHAQMQLDGDCQRISHRHIYAEAMSFVPPSHATIFISSKRCSMWGGPRSPSPQRSSFDSCRHKRWRRFGNCDSPLSMPGFDTRCKLVAAFFSYEPTQAGKLSTGQCRCKGRTQRPYLQHQRDRRLQISH